MKKTYTFYHNPNCSKSRAALALLEENDVDLEIIYYLDNPLSIEEIKSLKDKLGVSLQEMLRSSEEEYELYDLADSSLNEEIVLDIVSKHPILIQRPIIADETTAIFGRPPELVLTVIKENNS